MLSAAAEEEKLHQVTFNTNHVLCSSAAAAGCWILGQKSSHQFSFNINMFSAALILLLAAGSCEELSVDSH
ncbi:hypothetical protein F7725_003596 [Dissostichus mawsoni]|uniref:Uncharacterized protein n=1 Tax=Dissostichus mawsoni TaxID=36200 RepID=A0A7J5YE04_DISMA|nr:hypothetical protein F7725_003596 [Dissostichus mawsoni]